MVTELELVNLLNAIFNKIKKDNILILDDIYQPELKISSFDNHYTYFKEAVKELYPPRTNEYLISKGFSSRTIETTWDVIYAIASYGVFSLSDIEDVIRRKLGKKFYVSSIGAICKELSKEGILIEHIFSSGIRRNKFYSLSKSGEKYIEKICGIKSVASKLNEHLEKHGKIEHSFITNDVVEISKEIFDFKDIEIVYKFENKKCIPYIEAKKDGQMILIQIIDERFYGNSEIRRVNKIISNYDKIYFIAQTKDEIDKFLYYTPIIEEKHTFSYFEKKTIFYTIFSRYMKNEYYREVVIENNRSA